MNLAHILPIFRLVCTSHIKRQESWPVTAVSTRRAVLHRQYLGGYCSSLKPWQQNNIRRNWSDEPVMLEKEMNGGVIESIEKILAQRDADVATADPDLFLPTSTFCDVTLPTPKKFSGEVGHCRGFLLH